MPVYEYKCNSCKNEFEIMQKITDEPEAICPECESEDTDRLISKCSFKLKGDGWYETDYKNKKK